MNNLSTCKKQYLSLWFRLPSDLSLHSKHIKAKFSIRDVATQGRHDANQWVTSFSLAYFNWVYIRENSQVKVVIEKSTENDISVVVSILG